MKESRGKRRTDDRLVTKKQKKKGSKRQRGRALQDGCRPNGSEGEKGEGIIGVD